MKTEKEAFDYEATKQKALEQFRSGKSLYGKDGAFAPLLKDFLETALELFFVHCDPLRRFLAFPHFQDISCV